MEQFNSEPGLESKYFANCSPEEIKVTDGDRKNFNVEASYGDEYIMWRTRSSFIKQKPEKELVAAVLKDAISILHVRTTVHPFQIEETKRWFISKVSIPFSFEWCCDHLGLSSSATRKLVLLDANKNRKN